MQYVYWIFLAAVIGGHLFFAYGQWRKWPDLCAKLTDLDKDGVRNSAFLGRSIGSYNACVGIGLLLTFRLEGRAEADVQTVILLFIVATACVGWWGTKHRSHTILIARLAPAAIALGLLIWLVSSDGWLDVSPTMFDDKDAA